MSKAASYWPRAIKQARRHADQLIIYGLGVVHDNSTWGSASLLDRFGRSTPALQAIARALGRVYRDHEPPAAPAGDLVTRLPDGEPVKPHPLPSVTQDPDAATGASVDHAAQDVGPDVATVTDDTPVPPLVADDPPSASDGPAVGGSDATPVTPNDPATAPASVEATP